MTTNSKARWNTAFAETLETGVYPLRREEERHCGADTKSADDPTACLMEEKAFAALLSSLILVPNRVELTKNRSSLVVARPKKDGTLHVRVQHVFRAADKKTIQALAGFVQKPNAANREIIDRFLSKNKDLIRFLGKKRRVLPVKTKGKNRDLLQVLARVGNDYNMDVSDLRISWSKARAKKGQRTIRFGSYVARTKTILIHPILDTLSVPDLFVEYVVYHELLHAVYAPTRTSSGRRRIHGPEFQAMEKRFRQFTKAREFEKEFVKNFFG